MGGRRRVPASAVGVVEVDTFPGGVRALSAHRTTLVGFVLRATRSIAATTMDFSMIARPQESGIGDADALSVPRSCAATKLQCSWRQAADKHAFVIGLMGKSPIHPLPTDFLRTEGCLLCSFFLRTDRGLP